MIELTEEKNRYSPTRLVFMDILDHPTVSFLDEYKKSIEMTAHDDVQIEFMSMAQHSFERIQPEDFDGYILSGSITPYCSDAPWIASLSAFIRRVHLNKKIPLLGLCMVHELIASMFGGLVLPGEKKEIGVIKNHVTDDGKRSFLLQGLEPVFNLLAAHSHFVIFPPKGAKILAQNHMSDYQIFAYDNLFGIQSHPEVGADAMKNWMRTREGTKGLIEHGLVKTVDDVESYMENNVPECPARLLIFKNFIKHCRETKNGRRGIIEDER